MMPFHAERPMWEGWNVLIGINYNYSVQPLYNQYIFYDFNPRIIGLLIVIPWNTDASLFIHIITNLHNF